MTQKENTNIHGKTKVYRVIVIVGRKRTAVYESAAFAETDGVADWNAWKDAARIKEKHSMALWCNGNTGGRVDLSRCTK